MNDTATPPARGTGLGCAQLGNLYRAIGDDEARATVDAAWDAGVRYFDVAPHYGLGLAERRLGAALRDRPREEYTLSTKVGRLLVPRDNPGGDRDEDLFEVPADFTRRTDYSRDGVLRSVEESLERLGTDRIDIAYVHDPDAHYREALDGAFPALEELRSQGVVRSYGAGMNQAAMLADFVRYTGSDVMMVAGRWTLLDQSAADTLLPLARANGVAIVAAGVFNSGVLATGHPGDGARYDYAAAPPEILRRARLIAGVCRRHGVPLPVAAARFPFTDPAVTAVVLGADSAGQARDNAASAGTPVPDDLWDDLEQAGLIRRGPGKE